MNFDLDNMSYEDQLNLLDLLEEQDKRDNHLSKKMFTEKRIPEQNVWPREAYPKHLEFFEAGKKYPQRLFRAGNRVGKTTCAGYEVFLHMSGLYPDWWTGKKFTGPTSWWICGYSSETIAQILQPLLLGPVGEFGSGMIPENLLDFDSLKEAKKAGTSVGTFRVKHISGGYSSAEFKSYQSGRRAFEGTERSLWMDEEPPKDIYDEALLRTATGDNLLLMTFTPLKGASDVVMSFSDEGSFIDGPVGHGKHVTTCSWDDVPHLNEETKAMLIASLPPYQRDARTKGVPSLGSGAIFPIQEEKIIIEPIKIPDHWPRAYGLDVGWNRTAVIWIAYDRDTSTVYLYAEHYVGEATPSEHARAIQGRGKWIPGTIDPASRGRTQDDGTQLLHNYQDLGLNLVTADNSVEAWLWTMLEMMQDGRFKVFSTLTNWVREFRAYARDEKGKVIKKNDHAMDAGRYAISTGLSIAKTEIETKPKSITTNYGMPTKKW